ncbi:hypothetical protein MRS44_001210 [Fusarium solani]|uniref:uncharacterized protein n=1 Tax=Fusarium solani TaxID=169388 RepID=UPI0032C3FD71|nr:hypothetical protein MRS44_001210 [Fusarium solani]
MAPSTPLISTGIKDSDPFCWEEQSPHCIPRTLTLAHWAPLLSPPLLGPPQQLIHSPTLSFLRISYQNPPLIKAAWKGLKGLVSAGLVFGSPPPWSWSCPPGPKVPISIHSHQPPSPSSIARPRKRLVRRLVPRKFKLGRLLIVFPSTPTSRLFGPVFRLPSSRGLPALDLAAPFAPAHRRYAVATPALLGSAE